MGIIHLRPEGWVLWGEMRELQGRFDQQVNRLHEYCLLEQKKRSEKIVFIALTVIAISLIVLCLLAESFLIAIPSAVCAFLISAWVLRQPNALPMDPHEEVNDVLRNNGTLRYFDYDFFRFADERGLLIPQAILNAHALYKEHKALLVKNARVQLLRM